MRVRALDSSNDWQFGKGQNDYKRNRDAVAQDIQTRLNSFLGDCFFSIASGIDWFNLLGGKSQTNVALAVSATILNTEGVKQITDFSMNLTAGRNLTLSYKVSTFFGDISTVAPITVTDFLLTQDGSVLTTQDGSGIVL